MTVSVGAWHQGPLASARSLAVYDGMVADNSIQCKRVTIMPANVHVSLLPLFGLLSHLPLPTPTPRHLSLPAGYPPSSQACCLCAYVDIAWGNCKGMIRGRQAGLTVVRGDRGETGSNWPA